MKILETFVADIRLAAKFGEPAENIRSILLKNVAKADVIKAESPLAPGQEVHLFEDETVSIWQCCFEPHFAVPPHEHLVNVHIGVYSGVERNILLEPDSEGLRPVADHRIAAGELISLKDDCVHAVVADGEEVSLALHVYMGPLMQLKRGLFDWETGQRIDFTMSDFERLKRPVAEVDIASIP